MGDGVFCKLRDDVMMSDGRHMPSLFNFSVDEMKVNPQFYLSIRAAHGYKNQEMVKEEGVC
jgi:hypothetical protein